MPSSLGAAASWDQDSACDFGTVIGQELRAQGFNMTLGGGVDLVREPRNGRSFEYAGEDPLLSGTVVGNLMKCEQAQHVVGDIKHYAMNDQETGCRNIGVSSSPDFIPQRVSRSGSGIREVYELRQWRRRTWRLRVRARDYQYGALVL
jgi:beta-glucosidase-like glycosyl hydrolase